MITWPAVFVLLTTKISGTSNAMMYFSHPLGCSYKMCRKMCSEFHIFDSPECSGSVVGGWG